MDKLDPQHTIFYTIENAIKTYRKFAQKQLSDVVTGITVDQILILTVLEENPNIAQNEMAALLFKDYASITRMIELLVKNQYLSRTINEADRRKFVLKISAKGKAALKKLKPVIFKNRTNALKGVTESEVKHLFTTLNKIISNC
jgi:DNA-binding MarR family transcriptional regulator